MKPISRREQAIAGWQALTRDAVRRRWRSVAVREGPWQGAGPASLWALSQVVQAAVDLAAIGVVDEVDLPRLLRGVEAHRHGNAFDAFPGSGERYYDDSAWLALALVRAGALDHDHGYVDQARTLLSFLREGTRDGGVYWVERPRASRHTCSTGPAAELAFLLALQDPDADVDSDVAFGEAAMGFLFRELRRDDGLFNDHLTDDGTVEATVWSYNQGTPVGAGALWFALTGERAHLTLARETADAALAFFAEDDRLWRHPPAFNAIFLRNLLVLDDLAAVAGEGYPAAGLLLDHYLGRVWTEARDPATGWFTRGDIGRYGQGGVLDQSALVQLFAVAAARVEEPRRG